MLWLLPAPAPLYWCYRVGRDKDASCLISPPSASAWGKGEEGEESERGEKAVRDRGKSLNLRKAVPHSALPPSVGSVSHRGGWHTLVSLQHWVSAGCFFLCPQKKKRKKKKINQFYTFCLFRSFLLPAFQCCYVSSHTV